MSKPFWKKLDEMKVTLTKDITEKVCKLVSLKLS